MVEVLNLGESGKMVSSLGSWPFVNSPMYKRILISDADVIIFMLGTNDS